MTEEFELYLPEGDSSRALVLYRGEKSLKPLYLDIEELEVSSMPVRTQSQAFSGKTDIDGSEYYDEPIRLQDVERAQREQIEEEVKDEVEDDIEEEFEVEKPWYENVDKRSFAVLGFALGTILTYLILAALGLV